jgi:hypothetical protein
MAQPSSASSTPPSSSEVAAAKTKIIQFFFNSDVFPFANSVCFDLSIISKKCSGRQSHALVSSSLSKGKKSFGSVYV